MAPINSKSFSKVFDKKAGNDMTKKLHLEFMRIIAIILVIFNHTGERGFLLYTMTQESIFYWIYFFFSIACKIAVPLFWMISGCLLIEKEESIGIIYKKRVLRMVLVLVLFSLIHYAIPMVKHPEMRIFDVRYFFDRLLCSDGFAPAYWYLYAYIGVLLMLPVIQKAAKSMNAKEYIYLFTLALVFQGIIPISQYFWGKGEVNINGHFGEYIFPQNIIFFISGYYFEYKIDRKNLTGKRAAKLLLLGFGAIMISCFITKCMANMTGQYSETFYNSLIFIPTVAMFYLIRYLFEENADKINDRTANLIVVIGGTSFGIMLMEDVLRVKTQFVFEYLKLHCNPFLACILWVFTAWGCGVIGIMLVKKIPFIKKIL